MILGLLAVAVLPLMWTGLRVAVEQSTVASATSLLNDTIEDVRAIAADPTIACTAVEITNTDTDGRDVPLKATVKVITNTHTGPKNASGVATIVKSSGCTDFTAPGSLTVRVSVIRTDTGAELANAKTIVSVLTPPEDSP